MIRKFKNIFSLLLLMIFIFPPLAKLEHRHEHLKFPSNNEKKYSVHCEKCIICNFEFSVFLTNTSVIDLQKENPSDNYINGYNSRYNFNLSHFSFFLRAPPLTHQIPTT